MGLDHRLIGHIAVQRPALVLDVDLVHRRGNVDVLHPSSSDGDVSVLASPLPSWQDELPADYEATATYGRMGAIQCFGIVIASSMSWLVEKHSERAMQPV